MTIHPSSLIDQKAAIETMTASYVAGGYWDAHAVRVRPELHDVDMSHRWRLLEDLADDDDDGNLSELVDDHTYDGDLSPELTKVVRDWMIRRAAFAHRVLSEMPVEDGHVVAWRAVACKPDDLRPALGIHWSWDPTWDGGADTHWAPDDPACDVVLMIRARIPVSSVDWQTTMLCAMDYVSGDDERELRLLEDAVVEDVTIEIDGKEVPLPSHLVGSSSEAIPLHA
jgi:hypothetical protein